MKHSLALVAALALIGPIGRSQAQVEAYEVSNVHSMTVDGITYTRDRARFVAISRPDDTDMLVISRTAALNTISGYAINQLPRTDKYVMFPIITDSRLTRNQLFTVHTSLQIDRRPYVTERWLDSLPKRSCKTLGFKCVEKRRSVR